jgi:hypothetical protein
MSRCQQPFRAPFAVSRECVVALQLVNDLLKHLLHEGQGVCHHTCDQTLKSIDSPLIVASTPPARVLAIA